MFMPPWKKVPAAGRPYPWDAARIEREFDDADAEARRARDLQYFFVKQI
jgi:hypothetical protein